MTQSLTPASLPFEGWELRPLERALLVDGAPVPLGSRAFDVLVALATRHGDVVTKDELLDRAWPGLVVSENNIAVQIATLRKVLGAATISTVAGIGYRLSAVASARSTVARAAPEPLVESGRISPLVGRDADLDAIAACVASHALVTIVGTGGIGKTAAARETVARLPSDRASAVHWIDLAPLADATRLVSVVAKALGIEVGISDEAQDDVISALRDVQALIVLDNCEHVLDEVAGFVRSALEDAPRVRWLATSQERLYLTAETVYRLEPLGIPPVDASLDTASNAAAVALFARRAVAADQRFRLTDANVAIAIRICRLLDGLPLAIEMAAARIASLGLVEVERQLTHRPHLLVGSRTDATRHQTLRNTFDWSYDLLSDAEKRVFRRLEPFLDGFVFDMARIALDTGDAAPLDEVEVIDALSALVEKSLVHKSGDAQPRFRLFESARDYARDRLRESGEFERVRLRHAELLAAMSETARVDYSRMTDAQWGARYASERHNVRAALLLACEAGDPDLLARLVAGLARIDAFLRGAAEIVRMPVSIDVLERAATPLRAEAFVEWSWAHLSDGSREVGTDLARRALRDFEALGDDAGIYRSLAHLARLNEGRPTRLLEAKADWRRLLGLDASRIPLRTRLACSIMAGLQYHGSRTLESLDELRRSALRAGFDNLAASAVVQITDELLIQHRFEEAVARANAHLASGEPRPRLAAYVLMNRTLALVRLGRLREACEAARSALRALPGAANLVIGAFTLAAARVGRLEDAALMSGYAAHARRRQDEAPDPAEAEAAADADRILHAGLGEARAAELRRIGTRLSAAECLALAVATDWPEAATDVASESPTRVVASTSGVAN